MALPASDQTLKALKTRVFFGRKADPTRVGLAARFSLVAVALIRHRSPSSFPSKQVQTFGRKKTAVAVVHCKAGKGLIKFNGAWRCFPSYPRLGHFF